MGASFCISLRYLLIIPETVPVHRHAERHCSKDIDNRMLLHEYRRDRNQYSSHVKSGSADFAMKASAVPGCEADRQGTYYMERWTNIGIGISRIQSRYHIREYVIPWVF